MSRDIPMIPLQSVGGGGGLGRGQDHFSQEINWSFHNLREIKSVFNFFYDVFIIRPLPVMHEAKRRLIKNTKTDDCPGTVTQYC